MTYQAKDPDSLRLDQIGDVARPLTRETYAARVYPFACLVVAKKLPLLILTHPILEALRAGRVAKRGEVAAKSLGPILRAVVALSVIDGELEASRDEVRASVQALEAPALDALEDLFAYFPPVRPIVEVERMRRAGLLSGDWALSSATKRAGRIEMTIQARAMTPCTDA